MTGTAIYEEVQGFPGWTYALVAAVFIILAVVGTTRMTTRITPDGITVRWGFLYTSRVAASDIIRAVAIVYRPVGDYGGWGIKGSGRRRALSARGNQGVLLTRRDGSTIMVGTQHPRELLQALAHTGVPTEDKIPADVREF